jgi:hypothetical protein
MKLALAVKGCSCLQLWVVVGQQWVFGGLVHHKADVMSACETVFLGRQWWTELYTKMLGLVITSTSRAQGVLQFILGWCRALDSDVRGSLLTDTTAAWSGWVNCTVPLRIHQAASAWWWWWCVCVCLCMLVAEGALTVARGVLWLVDRRATGTAMHAFAGNSGGTLHQACSCSTCWAILLVNCRQLKCLLELNVVCYCTCS